MGGQVRACVCSCAYRVCVHAYKKERLCTVLASTVILHGVDLQ